MGKCKCHEDIKYLERKLTEEAHIVSILLQALECIIEPKDPVDPVKIAQDTLEGYAAKRQENE